MSIMTNNGTSFPFTIPSESRRLAVSTSPYTYHRTEVFVHDLAQVEGRSYTVVGSYPSFTSVSPVAGSSSGIVLAMRAGAGQPLQVNGKATVSNTGITRVIGLAGQPSGGARVQAGISGRPDLLLPHGRGNGRSHVDAFLSVAKPVVPPDPAVPLPPSEERLGVLPARVSFDL
jgi:hypothetical protein